MRDYTGSKRLTPRKQQKSNALRLFFSNISDLKVETTSDELISSATSGSRSECISQ